MNEAYGKRVRRMRERALVRSWVFRQRRYAKGAWYRLRRVLVDAAQAWIIDDPDADRLEGDGHAPLPVGSEFAPPKRLFFLTETELSAIPHRWSVPVRLCCELLQARNLVLIPHEGLTAGG